MKKLFIFCLVIIGLPLIVNAKGLIEDNDLRRAIEKYNSSSQDEIFKVEKLENGVMELKTDDYDIVMNYKEDNNIFTCDYNFVLKDGMSYQDYEKLTSSSTTPLLCYSLVADILDNVEIQDTLLYVLSIIIDDGLNNMQQTKIFIVEDEDSNLEFDEGIQTISKSDFPNHSLEYAKSIYGTSQTITDKNNLKSFTLTYIPKENTDSLEVTTSISIDLNADFRKLANTTSKITEELEKAVDSINITETNQKEETISNTPISYNSNNEVKSETLPETPQTGVGTDITKDLCIVIISILSIIIVRKYLGFKNF